DGDPVENERAERKRLGVSPVDAALVERRQAPLELARELRVHGEALRYAQELRRQLAQLLRGNAGVDRARGLARNALLVLCRCLAEARPETLVRLLEQLLGRGRHPCRLLV